MVRWHAINNVDKVNNVDIVYSSHHVTAEAALQSKRYGDLVQDDGWR